MSASESAGTFGSCRTWALIPLIFAYWALPPLIIGIFFPNLANDTRGLIILVMWILFFAIIVAVAVRQLWHTRVRQAKWLPDGKVRLPSGSVLGDDGELILPDDPQQDC